MRLFQALPGFLTFMYYLGDPPSLRPVLAALNMTTGAVSTLARVPQLDESLLQQSTAFLDPPTSTWVLSMTKEANITQGQLLQFDFAEKPPKLLPAVSSTYCWAIFSLPDPDSVLCITEWPWFNYSGPIRTRGGAGAASLRGLAPDLWRARRRQQRQAQAQLAAAAPAQEQFLLQLSRATGAATVVKRDWAPNVIPCNDAITMNRTDPTLHTVLAYMSDANSDQSYLMLLDANTGRLLAKTNVSFHTIIYALEFNHASTAAGGDASNSTYGIGTTFDGSAWGSWFARFEFDGKEVVWTQIGPSGTFDKYSYVEGVAAMAPSLGLFFAVAQGENPDKSLFFHLIGVDSATGLIAYKLDVTKYAYVSAIHYHSS